MISRSHDFVTCCDAYIPVLTHSLLDERPSPLDWAPKKSVAWTGSHMSDYRAPRSLSRTCSSPFHISAHCSQTCPRSIYPNSFLPSVYLRVVNQAISSWGFSVVRPWSAIPWSELIYSTIRAQIPVKEPCILLQSFTGSPPFLQYCYSSARDKYFS